MMDDPEISDVKLHSKRLGRELAMQYLFQLDLSGEAATPERWTSFVEQANDTHGLRDNRQARKGIEYAERLLAGIAAHSSAIDEEILKHTAHWDWERLALVDRNVMRVAVFEMLLAPDVPPVVSINEAVEIVRDYSGGQAGNFVNGVLNAIKETLKRPAREAVKKL